MGENTLQMSCGYLYRQIEMRRRVLLAVTGAQSLPDQFHQKLRSSVMATKKKKGGSSPKSKT
jgi:hypothetical protein